MQFHVHSMVYECVQCMCTGSSNSSQPMATTYSKFGTLPVQGIAITFLCTTMNLLLSYEYSPEGGINFVNMTLCMLIVFVTVRVSVHVLSSHFIRDCLLSCRHACFCA